MPQIQRKPGCSCGGFCPTCAAKEDGLTIGQPGDQFERQADSVAAKVMGMPEDALDRLDHDASGDMQASPPLEEAGTPDLQASFQPHPAAPPPKARPGGAPQAAAASRLDLGGAGRPLPRTERRFFERRLGAPLGHVRLHDGAKAASQAKRFQAAAFTHRNHIAFAAGAYRPGTAEGRHLLAHELVHVLQQGKGGPALQRMPDDAWQNTWDGDDTWVDPCTRFGKTRGMCRGFTTRLGFAQTIPRPCMTMLGQPGTCQYTSAGCRCMPKGRPPPVVFVPQTAKDRVKQDAYEDKRNHRRVTGWEWVPSLSQVLWALWILGLSLSVAATVLLALASPDPFTKMLSTGLAYGRVVALLVALGYSKAQINKMRAASKGA
ncbi:MAG: DUF4157 domain-containing protein [Pseudomonadota bacterium]